jgi:heparanase 1
MNCSLNDGPSNNDDDVDPSDKGLCLTAERWDEIVAFVRATGLRGIMFGLPGMDGRRGPGSNMRPWNSIQAERLINHISSSKQWDAVYSLGLGNELNWNTDRNPDDAPQCAAARLGADMKVLRGLVEATNPGLHMPLIVGPDVGFATNLNATRVSGYLDGFLGAAGDAVDALALHMYVDGFVDTNATAHAGDAAYLDKYAGGWLDEINAMPHLLPSQQVQISETAFAWGSGVQNLTDTFGSTLAYMYQFAVASSKGVTRFQRQTLLGGYYGLLQGPSMTPTPDYWAALLWSRMVGKPASASACSSIGIGGSGSGSKLVRTYCACRPGYTGRMVRVA